MTNYGILIICLFSCFTLPLKTFSQANCSTCLGSGNASYWCVTTATQLQNALYGTPPLFNDAIQSGGTVEICGTINLGEISADKFPLELPATNITLVGDYNFVSGTRIVFPYLYKSGLTCATQQRVVNGEVIEQSLPVDEDEAIDLLTSATSPATAFVFKMQQGYDFKHCKLLM